jgi:Kef-type K+ transport system membrane component KefB
MEWLSIKTPIDNPVLIFAIVLLIILFAPLILKKFRIPGIVGLIIAGMVVGPNGANILARDSSIILFGTIGLLYIMFIAGLELDFNQFIQNRTNSFIYGSVLFCIPLILGLILTRYVLNLNLLQSALISIMLSTNTLVSYPIVIRLGLSKNKASTIAVGGTIITDSCVLISLGFIEHFAKDSLDILFVIKTILLIALYVCFIFWAFPRITKFFFRKIELEPGSQYIFVLAMLFFGASLSQFIGLEPIIGAFLSGLALNRFIPNTSVLMGRIEFIGNSIFIPFFLISVGMLVNITAIINSIDSIGIGFLYFATSLLGIYFSTLIAKKVNKLSSNQRFLILGLNSSHAAATIAITLVGYNLGILNEVFINATVFLILISCIFSSFMVEKYGKGVAIASIEESNEQVIMPQRIIVPFANPNTVQALLELAFLIKEDSAETIFPLSVVTDSSSPEEVILKNYVQLKDLITKAQQNNMRVQLISRVDTSIADGIARAIKEILANCVIIGWSGKSSVTESIIGSQLDSLLNITNTMILVTRLTKKLNDTKSVKIIIPKNSELEIGYHNCITLIYQLVNHLNCPVYFIGFEKSLFRINSYLKKFSINMKVNFSPIVSYRELLRCQNDISENDLCLVINSRGKGISYSSDYNDYLHQIIKNLVEHNIIILYPEQSSVFLPDIVYTNPDVLDTSLISNNITLYNKMKRYFRK